MWVMLNRKNGMRKEYFKNCDLGMQSLWQELGDLQFTSYMGCTWKPEFTGPVFIEMMFLHTLEIDARFTNNLAVGPLVQLNTVG